MNHATRERKYENNVIVPRQQHEDDFAYILRKQKLHKIVIWVYAPCGEGKLEMFKPVDEFDKERKDDRILVGLREDCDKDRKDPQNIRGMD